MNMYYPKENLRSLKPINDTDFKYIWDKDWVRPYESPISVYMNFCNINAISYSQIIYYWRIRGSYEHNTDYSEDLNCFFTGSRIFVKTFIEKLLPEDYKVSFPKLAGEFGYDNCFRYCPECIKQGYHSLLSQLPQEKTCPIHNINYVASKSALVLGFKEDFYDIQEELGEFPLPCERKELDFSKMEEKVKEYSSIYCMNYFIPAKTCHDRFALDYDELVKTREFVCKVDRSEEFDSYYDAMWDYLIKNASAIFKTSLLNKSESMEMYLTYIRDTWYVDFEHLVILACLLDIFKDADTPEFPGRFPWIFGPPGENECISPSNMSSIIASYCLAVRGCWSPSDVFDFAILTHPHCGSVLNVFIKPYLKIDGAMYKLEEPFKNRENVSIAASKVVIDHIMYQFKRYVEIATEHETFDFYYEYKKTRPLMYEAIQTVEGDIYIYRMVM